MHIYPLATTRARAYLAGGNMQPGLFTSMMELEASIEGRLDELGVAPGQRRLAVLVIGDDASQLMKDRIVARANQMHFRSADHIDFYIVGWSRTVDYPIGKDPKVSVHFQPQRFSQCVDVLSDALDFRYRGGTDLIIVDAVMKENKSYLDLRYAIGLNLDRRIEDGTLSSVDALVEALIDFAKIAENQASAQGFYNKRLLEVTASSLPDLISNLSLAPIAKVLKHVIYFKPRDLRARNRVLKFSHETQTKGLRI